jgi:hypothetical protein
MVITPVTLSAKSRSGAPSIAIVDGSTDAPPGLGLVAQGTLSERGLADPVSKLAALLACDWQSLEPAGVSVWERAGYSQQQIEAVEDQIATLTATAPPAYATSDPA